MDFTINLEKSIFWKPCQVFVDVFLCANNDFYGVFCCSNTIFTSLQTNEVACRFPANFL